MSWLPIVFDCTQDNAAESRNEAIRIGFDLPRPGRITAYESGLVDHEEIIGVVHYLTPKQTFKSVCSESAEGMGFSFWVGMMTDSLRDWIYKNRKVVFALASSVPCIEAKSLDGGRIQIDGIDKLSEDNEHKFVAMRNGMPEYKVRAKLLAALDALLHEQQAELAYYRKDLDGLAVHITFMFRSLSQFGTYEACHDGRALRQECHRGGRSLAKRNGLKALMKKICPEYLDAKFTYRELWEMMRRKLEGVDSIRTRNGSVFTFEDEPTSDSPTAGAIIEKLPHGNEQQLGFSGFYRAISSLRKMR